MGQVLVDRREGGAGMRGRGGVGVQGQEGAGGAVPRGQGSAGVMWCGGAPKKKNAQWPCILCIMEGQKVEAWSDDHMHIWLDDQMCTWSDDHMVR